MPNGNLLVPFTSEPSNTSPAVSVLLEVDPDSGEILGGVVIDGISAITGATPGPNGLLILTTVDEIVVVDPTSGAIADRLAIAGAIQPCFLPNGNLLVIESASSALQAIDETGGALREIDLASGQIVATLASGASGFTMVPYRFRAVVQGALASPDHLSNVREFGELSLSPGMRRIMLEPDAGGDISALLDTDALVLFGSEAPDQGMRRLFHGSQVPSSDSGGPLASLVLRVVGKGDLFAPATARGSLHVAGPDGIFTGHVTTAKLLNR